MRETRVDTGVKGRQTVILDVERNRATCGLKEPRKRANCAWRVKMEIGFCSAFGQNEMDRLPKCHNGQNAS